MICRAQENGKRTPMGIAFALESACMLQSPEIAAELESLRKLPAELETLRAKLREANAGAIVADDLYREWQRRASSAEDWSAELQRRNRALCESVERLDGIKSERGAEIVALRARVDEVERRYIFDTAALKKRVAELEAAAGDGSTRPVDEDPIAYALTERCAAEFAALKAKATREALLAEQRHQYLDLDPDSVCCPPGFTCVTCPPKRDEAVGIAPEADNAAPEVQS